MPPESTGAAALEDAEAELSRLRIECDGARARLEAGRAALVAAEKRFEDEGSGESRTALSESAGAVHLLQIAHQRAERALEAQKKAVYVARVALLAERCSPAAIQAAGEAPTRALIDALLAASAAVTKLRYVVTEARGAYEEWARTSGEMGTPSGPDAASHALSALWRWLARAGIQTGEQSEAKAWISALLEGLPGRPPAPRAILIAELLELLDSAPAADAGQDQTSPSPRRSRDGEGVDNGASSSPPALPSPPLSSGGDGNSSRRRANGADNRVA